jgi:acyl carrier protein
LLENRFTVTFAVAFKGRNHTSPPYFIEESLMSLDAAQDVTKLHDVVRSIVVEELEIEPEELEDTASFEDDYDADSLSLLAIVARFENELGVVIPTDRIGEMLSYQKVLAVFDEFSRG